MFLKIFLEMQVKNVVLWGEKNPVSERLHKRNIVHQFSLF